MSSIYVSENLVKSEKARLASMRLKLTFATNERERVWFMGQVRSLEDKIAKLEDLRMKQDGGERKSAEDVRHDAAMKRCADAFAALGL